MNENDKTTSGARIPMVTQTDEQLESNPAAPTGPPERNARLDVLRGVAVLGILIMNIQSFSMISSAYFNPPAY